MQYSWPLLHSIAGRCCTHVETCYSRNFFFYLPQGSGRSPNLCKCLSMQTRDLSVGSLTRLTQHKTPKTAGSCRGWHRRQAIWQASLSTAPQKLWIPALLSSRRSSLFMQDRRQLLYKVRSVLQLRRKPNGEKVLRSSPVSPEHLKRKSAMQCSDSVMETSPVRKQPWDVKVRGN